MKYLEPRPYAKPEAAAAKLIEIAQGLRVDEGRMSVGKWNDAFRAAGQRSDGKPPWLSAWLVMAGRTRSYQKAAPSQSDSMEAILKSRQGISAEGAVASV